MITRRQFLTTGAVAAADPAVAVTAAGCSGVHRYEEQARLLRRPLTASNLRAEQLQDLVRCATLAAKSF